MRKVTVITQKELVKPDLLSDAIVVVLDVFLATSTIVELINKGYEPVLSSKNIDEALEVKERFQKHPLMLGEKDGNGIDGFEYPDPRLVTEAINQQPAIICSTNGTRAIDLCYQASTVLVSSLMNGHYVAQRINNSTSKQSIVLVCAGNAGRFSLEDYVGAGQVVDRLLAEKDYQLSDSAKLAQDVFQMVEETQFAGLFETETAALLRTKGYEKAMNFVVERVESLDIAPTLTANGFREISGEI